MKKKHIKIYGKINEKYRKYVVGIIVIMFIISTILAIKAIKQPLETEEKVVKNTIEEKTSFDYSAVVNPSTLYPSGGRVITDKVIFNNITQDFITKFNASINTKQPVKIDATKEIVYTIVAEDMWEREFVLSPKTNIKSEGVSNNLLNEEVHVNLINLNAYLNKIEEETLVRPNYTMIIKSKILGNVYDENGNVIYELNNILEVPFDISGQYIKFAGESPEKEFIKTNDIEDVKKVPQNFYLVGMKFDILTTRIVFGILSLITLILTLIYVIEKLQNNKESFSELKAIDKKNKNKIVTLVNKINLDNSPNIALKSFNDISKIAEEKEETIFKYTDNITGIVYFYITSTNYIYFYRCLNNEGSESVQDA